MVSRQHSLATPDLISKHTHTCTLAQTHVYGDDSEEFQGRHEFQSAGDPYDAPVRVSKSTERRSGNFRLVLVRF